MKESIKIFADDLDSNGKKQIKDLANSPLMKGQKLRIMPDAHSGAGCVIGTTLTFDDKICPNIVGVDIGCGMLVGELGELDIPLKGLDFFIRQEIPSGFQVHHRATDDTNLVSKLRCFEELEHVDRIYRSLGTLGGGNHFIEINEDTMKNKYLVIHTGSRNLGKQVADIYQRKGKKENPYGNLSFITGRLLEDYLHDMEITQTWASYNRKLIFEKIKKFLYGKGQNGIKTWETIHNYVCLEDKIIRKGAIRAKKGERVLIPLNMKEGSLICTGKGNPDWNYSAPHGAGRVLSRRQAKKHLSTKSFLKEMEGIYTTTANKKTLDEAPMAYKDSKKIINAIGDSVDIEEQIRPIYNFKSVE
ncbi:MAG: RtcB family protein [Tissierellia bacterium]|nr:RtcB family protein [Tissierellia bacterium]